MIIEMLIIVFVIILITILMVVLYVETVYTSNNIAKKRRIKRRAKPISIFKKEKNRTHFRWFLFNNK